MADPISKTTFGSCERVGDLLVCGDEVVALGAVLFPENETVDPSIEISPDEIMRF